MRAEKITFLEIIIFVGGLYWIFTTNSSETIWTMSILLSLGFLAKSYLIYRSLKDKDSNYYKNSNNYGTMIKRIRLVNDEDDDDDDDDDEITDKYGKSSVYSLKCKEVVKMLESGDYIFRVTYVTQCYEGYFQLKDDVDVKIMNDPIKYAELPDDLLVPAEEYFGKQDNKEVININKPWFKGDPYVLQETYVGEIIDGVNSLEYLINGLKNFIKEKKIEGSEDVTFSDYIDAQYDHVEGWWYQDGSLFERVRDYKIGFIDIRIFNKDGFRYYDFDDVISYLLIDEDMLEHDDYYNRIDFFIQPA